MLRSKIFLVSLFIAHSCFSMDYCEMLGNSAKPIHDFLTLNVDKSNESMREQTLSDFITSFKNLNTPPSILCDLPDKREYKSYTYTCPAGEQYQIGYYDTNAQKHNDTVNGGATHTINGRPMAVHITKNGKKRTITLSDPAALFSDKRKYNLIKLLFDCDRADEAQRIISATEKPFGLAFASIVPSFQAVCERFIECKSNKMKGSLNNLEQRMVKEEKKYREESDEKCLDCCLIGCQGLCGLSLLMMAMDPTKFKILPKVALMAAGGMEGIKQRDWIGKKLSGLKMKKD